MEKTILSGAKARNYSYRATETARLAAAFPKNEVVLSPDMENVLKAKWRLATNLAINAQMDLFVSENELHAIERVPTNGRGQPTQLIPIRFVFTNKLDSDDKLLVAFDAFTLSKSLDANQLRRSHTRRLPCHVEGQDLGSSGRDTKTYRKNCRVAGQSLVARPYIELALRRVRISNPLPQGGQSARRP